VTSGWGRKAASGAGLALAAVLLGACQQAESTYVSTPERDVALQREMGAAIAEAKTSFPAFWAKYDAAKPGEGDFLVKAGMTDRYGGKEFIWMDVVSHTPEKVVGRLANKPEYLDASLRQGSQVEVNVADLSDWAYEKDGKFYGQYTTRVLLSRMTPSQRAEAMETLTPTPLEPQTH
jgi:uncharacterized protein YegJ (DUF2314 family)